jgi:glycosyltransferase involved in cell wall biosynthesis
MRVSFLVPTLNSGPTLDACLARIRAQRTAHEIEIIVADGGSIDDTRAIAGRHGARVIDNPLKTGEAGKAVALAQATGEFAAFVDSDNFLIGDDWLDRLLAPFLADPAVVLAEPLNFQWNPAHPPISRYCALLGMNDPLCHYTGAYDKWNLASNRWTGLDVPVEEHGDWFSFERTTADPMPTIGANGTVWRRSALGGLEGIDRYFFDVDVPHRVVARDGRARFAKVRAAVEHLYCRNFADFRRKQRRRVTDFLAARHSSEHRAERVGHANAYGSAGIVAFALAVALVLPCLWVSLRGFLRKPDAAWWLHWPLCATTLWIYGTATIAARFRPPEMRRDNWQAPAAH